MFLRFFFFSLQWIISFSLFLFLLTFRFDTNILEFVQLTCTWFTFWVRMIPCPKCAETQNSIRNQLGFVSCIQMTNDCQWKSISDANGKLSKKIDPLNARTLEHPNTRTCLKLVTHVIWHWELRIRWRNKRRNYKLIQWIKLVVCLWLWL